MARIEVRRAVPSDASAIRQIGQDAWPATYVFAGEAYIAHGLETWWSHEAVLRGIGTTETFVAETDGTVIGMGNIDLRPATPIIWKLYVLPEHQGIGAGHALITKLLSEAPTTGDVLLEYTDGNTRAAEFYRRHGFVELRRDPPDSAGWPEQVWMARRSGQQSAGRADRR